MRKISKSKLKPSLLKVFRDIEKTGEEIIVTDHGQSRVENIQVYGTC